jgi:hypothetical protein
MKNRPTKRTRPGVIRKQDSYIAVWLSRVDNCIKEMDELLPGEKHHYKVNHIAEWLDERYATYRDFKPLFKKIIVGKCLTQLGYKKRTYEDHGWIYIKGDE